MASLPLPSLAGAKGIDESRFSDVMAYEGVTDKVTDRSKRTNVERPMLRPTAEQQIDQRDAAESTAENKKLEVDVRKQHSNVTVDLGVKRKYPGSNGGGADDVYEGGLYTCRCPPNPLDNDVPSTQLVCGNENSSDFDDGSSGATRDGPCLATLNACLDVLVYQDGALKPVTSNTIKLIEEAKGKLSEANALFIKGILVYEGNDILHYQPQQTDLLAYEYLSEAHTKGCQHPILYYFLGECCRRVYDGEESIIARGLQFYDMAAKGMLSSLIFASVHLPMLPG